jgi:hypothetical protein
LSGTVKHITHIVVHIYVAVSFHAGVNMDEKVRRKFQQAQWIDSESRFLARVSVEQDCPPFIRLDISVPRDTYNGSDGEMGEIPDDNIFIALHDVLLLRPYNKHNAMLTANPSLHEVAVTVDNFWSTHESGGNSGHTVRRATIYVSGDTETLGRLCGDKNTALVSKQSKRGGTDKSGIRGLSHVLQGPINLRRLRTKDSAFVTNNTSRWVCIDYSPTHHLYCTAHPICQIKDGLVPVFTNSGCLHPENLFLKRIFDITDDTNAIAIVQQSSGNKIVGFIPPELAACLAPAMDASVVTISKKGVYSEKDPRDRHHRVWFCVNIEKGRLNSVDILLIDKLRAISWWVSDTDEDDHVA